MAKFPFTDKSGRIVYTNPENAFERKCNYTILCTGEELLCVFTDNLYNIPDEKDIFYDGNIVHKFTTIAYITENKHYIKEQQNYTVYAVEKTELPHTSFQWCKISDILLNKISFNATQLVGIKNLIVRATKS